MQVVQTQGVRHSDVMVKDIMTPCEKLEVLCMDNLVGARVGDIIATLQTHGRQHALVVERSDDQSQILRGMFSSSATHSFPFLSTAIPRGSSIPFGS